MKICTISDITPSKGETGFVMHRISMCRLVVVSGLDTLVWDEPIRNGMGQVETVLGHVSTNEIFYEILGTQLH